MNSTMTLPEQNKDIAQIISLLLVVLFACENNFKIKKFFGPIKTSHMKGPKCCKLAMKTN